MQHILEEQSSKRVYRDETGDVILSVAPFGIVLCINQMDEPTLSNMKHWIHVIDGVDTALRQRGYDEYFTLVGSVEAFRFAEFYGFETTMVVFNNQYELMRKAL